MVSVKKSFDSCITWLKTKTPRQANTEKKYLKLNNELINLQNTKVIILPVIIGV